MESLKIELNNFLVAAGGQYQSCKATIKERFEEMPDNTVDAAVVGASLTFCVATVISGSAAIGVTFAACAGLASLIDGLVNPFFEAQLAEKGRYTDAGRTIKNVVCLIVAGAVVGSLTGTPIPLLIPIVCIAANNIFFLPQDGWNSNSSSIYVVP